MPDRPGYERPGWTGEPMRFTDGGTDSEMSQCPSCLSFHHANYVGCNGKREPSDRQCEASIGEIRCHRPDGHLEEHDARSALLHVSWHVPEASDG